MSIAMRYGSGDYSRSGGASGGGSAGGITMTLLWTNPSPTSTFAAQTVQLDLSGYDAVVISFRTFTDTQQGISSVLCIKGEKCNMGFVSASNNRNGLRFATPSNTGIDFSACTYNAGGTNNAYGVPIYIYGIKGIT